MGLSLALLLVTLGAYGTASVLTLLGARRPDYGRWGRKFAAAAFFFHTFLLVHRGLGERLPFLSLFSWVLVFTWFVVGLYYVALYRSDEGRTASFLWPAIFFFLLPALFLDRRDVAAPPSFRGYWIWVHLGSSIAAYAIFLLAAVAAVLYVIEERELRGKFFRPLYRRLPSLESLDERVMGLTGSGFILLALALLAGSLAAKLAWGHYWDWDPKEVWTAGSLLIYGLPLLGQSRGWGAPLRIRLSLLGFLSISLNLLVVNLFFPGPHRYNF